MKKGPKFYIKSEGKGDGTYYRIPIIRILFLAFFLLLVSIIGSIYFGQKTSPLMVKKLKLEAISHDNKKLDTLIDGLKDQSFDAKERIARLDKRTRKFKQKLSVPDAPDLKTGQKRLHVEEFSPKFLQSYTDSTKQYLHSIARESEKSLWSTIPVISPIVDTTALILVKFGGHFEIKDKREMQSTGILLAAPFQSSVVATANGTVVSTGNSKELGTFCEISHAYGLNTRYSVLGVLNVKKGQKIVKGQKIGTIGSPAWAVGPRLYYEILKKEIPCDPLTIMMPEAIR